MVTKPNTMFDVIGKPEVSNAYNVTFGSVCKGGKQTEERAILIKFDLHKESNFARKIF